MTSYRYGVTAEKAGALALARLAAVCNTVTPEVRQGVLKYDGDSPDEIALMESLRLNGITLTERTKAGIVIEGEMLDGYAPRIGLVCLLTTAARHNRGRETWTIHNVLTFSSARKRMAVIASRPGSDELILFEKGADSVILERLANKDSPQVRAIIRVRIIIFWFRDETLICFGIPPIAYRCLCQARTEDAASRQAHHFGTKVYFRSFLLTLSLPRIARRV